MFNAIVIKNSALNEKYPGGLRAYIEKHGGRCNRMLTADSFMGDEVDAIIEDLCVHGLEYKKDFLCVDAGGYEVAASLRGEQPLKPKPVDLGVDWFKASCFRGEIIVRHVEGPGR